ncbi:alpha-amylase family protein [Paenibacillus hexagrammi]|uniref:Alpha-amylase n=1 Tax=Paenibacillus hexagrammi TaxID=2908839 RepID=A0ABY3SE62_9BACL|nr:alpha-amylase [Paenibacillus sp. YPD9-1]UJF31755.1 alpha-amylase [Paenibacillus sp. YPD9-1]
MLISKTKEKNLESLIGYLSGSAEKEEASFWIPAIWNECGYTNILEEKDGEIRVHPYAFLTEHLTYVLKMSKQYGRTESTDFANSVIYSSLVRYSTAWDYDHDGEIESGTFLRMMMLLPLLKKMGVTILYILPVNRYSKLNLKGDIGSPYAVQTLFDLDPNLHDPLLDGAADWNIHDEMAVMVEVCHLLDIKVVVDFIPRVTARNSEWVREHPEWVYWIKNEALDGFKPPHIPELGFFEECTPDKLETVYNSKETAEFLAKFSQPPHLVDSDLWEELKQRSDATGEELLTLVEQHMGITTSPAHSDWINDVQPIWTDITFLRLYQDFAPQVRSYLKPDQAPYVLFDTIKCNYYPGEEPTQELWDVLVDAIRFHLERYGIDGFRIDIGHVLPTPLLTRMFSLIQSMKPDAILISEDLFNRNHEKAAATGYNIMLGSGWNIMTQITKENLIGYASELPQLKLHVFACAETADTPRITSRGGVKLARMISVFNHFLPNAIPFLTTGFEMNEEQPLNCGLGDNTNGAEIPRAFFNQIQINWTNPQPMLPLLEKLNQCKQRWLSLVQANHFFIPESPEGVVIYGYMDEGQLLLGLFNLNPEESVQVDLDAYIPGVKSYRVEIDTEGNGSEILRTGNVIELQPQQAIVLSHSNTY